MIILVRHADAVAEGPELPDACRYLTPAGRAAAAALGAALAQRGLVAAAVVSSPLARALQTAELLARALGFDGAIEVAPWLAPGASEDRAVEGLRRRPAIAVGHEPALSAFGKRLTGGAVALLHKAEAVAIEGGREQWRVAIS